MRTEPKGPTAGQADPLMRLVAAIAAGDESALASLYDQTSARVHGLALKILRDRSAAEEVVLEVYSQVWRQAERYDSVKGTVATWLLTLARSRAIDSRRARARHEQLRENIEEALDLSDPAAGPDQLSIETERARRIRGVVSSLPREQRVAIEAAFFDGLTHTEVARLLDAPLGTVKTRIRAGLLAIRLALTPAKEGLA
ncbi:MAG: sigma-70 family RNA polymerase sigma factor [Planctomycetota bacterium]